MKRLSTIVSLLLVSFFSIVFLSCHPDEGNGVPDKPESELKGTYNGNATNKANSSDQKPLSMTITSTDNPVAGTYNLNGTSGKLTGSVLGMILSMTFKPDASGTTYNFSGTSDNNASISGTLTGVESSTTVTYTVLVKK
ncbi:hypothetical protein [Spirosoma aerolatum]|uniref:hypothetical protein n=1 Tax=Spirosoma aerolatum TaxID=1211326 RepID=UPI0009AE4EEF|nr:hypothetical protein [Spirosoma aerolatum]